LPVLETSEIPIILSYQDYWRKNDKKNGWLPFQQRANKKPFGDCSLLISSTCTKTLPNYNANYNAIHNANLSKGDLVFLSVLSKFHKIREEPFSVESFGYKPVTFRQKIHRIRSHIEIVIPGRPTFYKVKGVSLSNSITLKPMGVLHLETILRDCKNQTPMIHDVRFKVISDLHEKLLTIGLSQHKQNHSIVLTDSILPSPNPNLNIKLISYPKHFQLIVGCSLHPIIFDISSLTDLWFILGKYINQLESFVGSSFLIQPLSKWTHTHSHLNKDGSIELSGESFHCTQEDYNGVLYRVYSKSFSDGNRIRVETVDTEKKSLADMIKGVIEN